MKTIHKVYVALSPLPIWYYLYLELSSEVPFQDHNLTHEQIEWVFNLILILGFSGLVLIVQALYTKQNVRWLVFGFLVSTYPIWMGLIRNLFRALISSIFLSLPFHNA